MQKGVGVMVLLFSVSFIFLFSAVSALDFGSLFNGAGINGNVASSPQYQISNCSDPEDTISYSSCYSLSTNSTVAQCGATSSCYLHTRSCVNKTVTYSDMRCNYGCKYGACLQSILQSVLFDTNRHSSIILSKIIGFGNNVNSTYESYTLLIAPYLQTNLISITDAKTGQLRCLRLREGDRCIIGNLLIGIGAISTKENGSATVVLQVLDQDTLITLVPRQINPVMRTVLFDANNYSGINLSRIWVVNPANNSQTSLAYLESYSLLLSSYLNTDGTGRVVVTDAKTQRLYCSGLKEGDRCAIGNLQFGIGTITVSMKDHGPNAVLLQLFDAQTQINLLPYSSPSHERDVLFDSHLYSSFTLYRWSNSSGNNYSSERQPTLQVYLFQESSQNSITLVDSQTGQHYCTGLVEDNICYIGNLRIGIGFINIVEKSVVLRLFDDDTFVAFHTLPTPVTPITPVPAAKYIFAQDFGSIFFDANLSYPLSYPDDLKGLFPGFGYGESGMYYYYPVTSVPYSVYSCVLSAPFGCSGVDISGKGVTLRIGMGIPDEVMDIDSVSISDCGALFDLGSFDSTQEYILHIPCTHKLTEGSNFRGDVIIIYHKNSSLIKQTSAGQVISKVVSDYTNRTAVACLANSIDGTNSSDSYCYSFDGRNINYDSTSGSSQVIVSPIRRGISVVVGEYANTISFEDFNNSFSKTVAQKMHPLIMGFVPLPDTLTNSVNVSQNSAKGSQIFVVNINDSLNINTSQQSIIAWASNNKLIAVFIENYQSTSSDLPTLFMEYLKRYPSTMVPKPGLVCNSGCALNGKCYPYGYRFDPSHCSLSGIFKIDSSNGVACQNNFECASNFCSANRCTDPTLFQKAYNWFKRAFGGQ